MRLAVQSNQLVRAGSDIQATALHLTENRSEALGAQGGQMQLLRHFVGKKEHAQWRTCEIIRLLKDGLRPPECPTWNRRAGVGSA
jgi:hypothetical protein